MASILVTGGAGFIGSHLTERLLGRGDHVTCLDDFNDSYDPGIKRANVAPFVSHPRWGLVAADICSEGIADAVYAGGIDVTVHLAARAGVRQSVRDPLLYERVNVTGTLQLLDAARRHGSGRFVFGSSSSVYGADSAVPFREDDAACQPASPYAATKRAGELLAYTYHRLHGLHVTVLRFFTVYGPRQRPEMAIHTFAARLAAGRSVPRFGDGSTSRDYTYVADIVDGIVAAIDASLPFEIVNLGGGRPVRLDALIGMLAGALGVTPAIEALPEQEGDMPLTCADVAKAARLLGWRPRVSIEEGIGRFAAWFQQGRE